MDWKNMETGAEAQIRNGEMDVLIGKIILKECVENVKKLGGKTNIEISDDNKLLAEATELAESDE